MRRANWPTKRDVNFVHIPFIYGEKLCSKGDLSYAIK